MEFFSMEFFSVLIKRKSQKMALLFIVMIFWLFWMEYKPKP